MAKSKDGGKGSSFPFDPTTRAAAAEEYAKRGWKVFPIHSVVNGACTCKNGSECKDAGKHPIISPRAIKEWSEEQTVAWWKKFPYANIGVWLEGSNVGVLDLDKHDDIDGEKNLALLYKTKNVTPVETMTCRTGSGGVHQYFTYDLEKPIPNTSNALGPGVDCWSGQHYLILPPSDHRSGKPYQWENWGTPPAPFPYGLLPEKRGPGRPRGSGQKENFDPRDRWQVTKMKRALELLEPVANDREMWVKIGMVMGRAFKWSDAGWEIYNEWAKRTDRDNYNEKGTHRNYYEWSKKPPSEHAEPITSASIYHWAKAYGELEEEEDDQRPFEFYENPTHPHDEQDQLSKIYAELPGVFRRDSMLIDIVEVTTEDDGTAVWRPRGYPVTRRISVGAATHYLAETTQWFNKTKTRFVKGRPEKSIIADFVDRYSPGWERLKPFRMLTTFQTVRDDGSILSEPGYDRKSGLYLVNPPAGVNIPKKIGTKQIKEALDALWEPFKHYVFEDGVQSKSALLSAIFTVCLRHLFPTVPMFAFTAGKAAAGKTKASIAISQIWFGKNPVNVRYTSDEEELSKILGSCALAGDRMVLFDNVREGMPVRDPVLAGLLTSSEFDFRILGTNERVKMSPVATFFMTGIKLDFSEEIQRRTMQVKIMPHRIPEGAPTPEAVATRNRANLIAAALTIIRGYYLAKCPKMTTDTLASFEEWGLIRDLILWSDANNPDPKGSISEDLAENEEVLTKREIVLTLHKMRVLSKPTTAEHLSSVIRANLDSRQEGPLARHLIALIGELAQDARGPDVVSSLSSSRALGRFLRKVSGIPFGHREGKVLILRRMGRMWIIEERDDD